jgi:hypothetical protein
MGIDALADDGGALVAIRFEDGTGVERRLERSAAADRVSVLLDGETLAAASAADLGGAVSLASSGDGVLRLRVGERTLLETTLPEPRRLALPRGMAFSAARFMSIETHRSDAS